MRPLCPLPVTLPLDAATQSLRVVNGLFNALALWFPPRKKRALNIS